MASDPVGSSCKPLANPAASYGAYTFTSITDSGLTATRVPFAGSGGLLTDSSAFTFTSGTGALAATTFSGAFDGSTVTSSALTSGRVPYASTAGLLTDAAAFTYTSGTLASTVFKGASQDTIAAKLTDGAIASAPGTIIITKGSALGSSTLATPTVTTHDGYILRIVSSTAYAHVISCASGKVNGGTTTTITFTSAAIGDSITLVAYQGYWYIVGTTGTITLT
jgi:hypothetical protein